MMAQRHPYHRGDVVQVHFPFSDPGGAKVRPALVLSTTVYHDNWDELLVVAITSRAPKTMRPCDCELQDWHAAGLSAPWWIRSHLATVHRTLIAKRLGQMSSRDLSAVEDCLRTASGL
jgi:mRNA interferase MazF